MKRSTPIKYTANTSRYNIRSKSDKPSGRKDTGGFFFYTYLRSADFLPRSFALRRKRQSMINLPRICCGMTSRAIDIDAMLTHSAADEQQTHIPCGTINKTRGRADVGIRSRRNRRKGERRLSIHVIHLPKVIFEEDFII